MMSQRCALFCLALLGLYVPSVARERPYESAERWMDTAVTAPVRLSCITLGFPDELSCRCAVNAGLAPVVGQCLEEYACERLGGNNCASCSNAAENSEQYTCKGLVSARNLRRGYTITALILFGLLFLVGVPLRLLSKQHPIKPRTKQNTMDYFYRGAPSQESSGDLAWMSTIRNMQWTFWVIFIIPVCVVFGTLISVIVIGGQGCFWDSRLKMPRWDHYTDSIQMPNGDYEEDWAMPTVSNTPEMYVECADSVRWIFAGSGARVNAVEVLHLVLCLPALFFLPAAHVLVAYCRLVGRAGAWPMLFYPVALGLMGGLVGVANIQGAYGKAETEAHWILSIVWFASSGLFELLVICTGAVMNTHWAPRWRSAMVLAGLTIVVRIAYVVMFFIKYPDDNDEHLTLYSTQNFLTWIFTFCQLWLLQSFPRALAEPQKPAAAPPVVPMMPLQPPPQPQWQPPPPPPPEPIQESTKLAPVFIPDGSIPLLHEPPPSAFDAMGVVPMVDSMGGMPVTMPGELLPYTEASLVHASWDEEGFLPIDAGLPPLPPLPVPDGGYEAPFVTESAYPEALYGIPPSAAPYGMSMPPSQPQYATAGRHQYDVNARFEC